MDHKKVETLSNTLHIIPLKDMLYAICDCDNCFVSCERVFRHDLNGRPVVVLSNNDGCVVSRSLEAKQLGIKMGMPYYQMKAVYSDDTVTAFSSNYELYADMTARIMSLIRKNAPAFFRYSIDEAFCVLPDQISDTSKIWGEQLVKIVKRGVGMPVSIGIARTKTLAKMAVHFAKTYPGYNGCCVINDESQRLKALSLTKIGDIWGIGRRLSVNLEKRSVTTALEFTEKQPEWIESCYNISVQRTWRELQGEDCIPNEEFAAHKSIMTSRSFESEISDLPTLRTVIANFAARGASKLRRQKSVASVIGVFVATNRYRNNAPQYGKMIDYTLSTPTDSTIDIVNAADKALHTAYRPEYSYKKAGVTIMGIHEHEGVQPDLFDYSPEHAEKMHRLDETLDSINRIHGRDTIVTGTQQYRKVEGDTLTVYSDIMRHDRRSPNPTTRWTDIIQLK